MVGARGGHGSPPPRRRTVPVCEYPGCGLGFYVGLPRVVAAQACGGFMTGRSKKRMREVQFAHHRAVGPQGPPVERA